MQVAEDDIFFSMDRITESAVVFLTLFLMFFAHKKILRAQYYYMIKRRCALSRWCVARWSVILLVFYFFMSCIMLFVVMMYSWWSRVEPLDIVFLQGLFAFDIVRHLLNAVLRGNVEASAAVLAHVEPKDTEIFVNSTVGGQTGDKAPQTSDC